jgi:hypothetical protein
MTLNWRHRAGLFFTLVAVGSALYLEVSAKQAVGIALLGIAFPWLVGNLTRRGFIAALGILLCAAGLCLAAAPVWSDWESVQKPASEYDLAVANLQSAVKTACQWEVVSVAPIPREGAVSRKSGVDYDALAKKYGGTTVSSPTIDFRQYADCTVEVPVSVEKWARPAAQTAAWEGQHAPKTLEKDWFAENAPVRRTAVAFAAQMSDAEIMKAFEANFLVPRPTFSLRTALRAHAWPMFSGLALFTSGLLSLCWLFRRTRIYQARA